MKKDHNLKISTPRGITILISICVLASLFLVMIGTEKVGRSHPVFLLVVSCLALVLEWKTIYISMEALQIRYNAVFLKRTVFLERIHSLEIIVDKDEYHLLFALDACPSYQNDKIRKYEYYIYRHPFKVISIRCSQEEAMACKQFFTAKGVHTEIIFKNPRSRRLTRR